MSSDSRSPLQRHIETIHCYFGPYGAQVIDVVESYIYLALVLDRVIVPIAQMDDVGPGLSSSGYVLLTFVIDHIHHRLNILLRFFLLYAHQVFLR
jgi:hypothetical protein